MLAFLLGLIVGVGGFWILVMERVRTRLYREKLAAYVAVQKDLVDLFLAANILKTESRPSRTTTSFYEQADLALLKSAARAALIADRKILHLAGEICDYDHRQVKENFSEYVKALDRLEEVMRSDLEVDRLRRLTRFFAAPPPAEPAFKAMTPAKSQIWKTLGSRLQGTQKESEARDG